MFILYPNYIFKRIYDIPVAFFREHGITTLLLDVDNTLTGDNKPEPDRLVLGWLEEQHKAGMRLMILSNNYKRRVKPFAEKLGLEFISGAAKPLPLNLKIALKKLKVDTDEAAIIGDQIFTDILCGRLSGCTAILVEPMDTETSLIYRLKRWAERHILKSYHKEERNR